MGSPIDFNPKYNIPLLEKENPVADLILNFRIIIFFYDLPSNHGITGK
jgi:hypothetical protein